METFLTENGEYVLFHRAPGRLLPDAVPAFRAAAFSGADFLYADEFLIENGKKTAVYKPIFSPDTLLSYNCIGSPVALSARLYDALGGSFDTAAAAYDLTLRAQENATKIAHVPRLLFEGPPDSAASCTRALRRALECAMRRRKCGGVLSDGAFPGSFRVRRGVPKKLSIDVILIYTGDVDAVRRTLEAVSENSPFLKCRYLLLYGCLPDERALSYFRALSDAGAVDILRRRGTEKAAKLKNLAAEGATGDLLLFLDPGVEPATIDSLEELASQAIRPDVGAVGGKVISPDRTILHAGLALGLSETPVSLFAGYPENTRGALFDRVVNCIRNVSAVSGGALMISRETFFAARGFDTTLPAAAVDADLCLRCLRAKRYNLYDPYAVFISRSPAGYPPLNRDDRLRLNDLFRTFAENGDPFVTQNPAAYGR